MDMSYVGQNLDYLEKRVRKALHVIGLLHDISAVIVIGILPNAMYSKDACMLWVAGHKYFYRVVVYRESPSLKPTDTFDGNIFIFEERLLTGPDCGCYMVENSGKACSLPNDWLANFVSNMQVEVRPEYKFPCVIGDPSDPVSWKWGGHEQDIVILGNLIK